MATEPRWYHCGRKWLILSDEVTCEEYLGHPGTCIVNWCRILWAVVPRGSDFMLLNPKLGSIGPNAVPVPPDD